MNTSTTLGALISDAIHTALDTNQIRLSPLIERRLIADATEHITLAGYTLTLAPPADLFDDTQPQEQPF